MTDKNCISFTDYNDNNYSTQFEFNDGNLEIEFKQHGKGVDYRELSKQDVKDLIKFLQQGVK